MAIEEFIARKRNLDGSTGTSKATIENHVVTYVNSETPSPYITEIKTLNGVSLVGSGNYAFDTAFDETSTNAVQNKVISKEVKELNYELAVLRETVFEVVLSEIDYTSVFTDSFAIPETLTDTDGTHRVVYSETELKKVSGNSVVVNQLISPTMYAGSKTQGGITFTNNGDGTITINGTATEDVAFTSTTFTNISGHTYLLRGCHIGGAPDKYSFSYGGGYKEYGNGLIIPANAAVASRSFNIQIYSGTTVNNLVFEPFFVDLTQRYGNNDKVDTIIGTGTSDEQVARLLARDTKILDDTDYNTGTIKSSIINGLQSLDSNNQVIGTITIPPTEIKSAGTAQDYIEVVEGDIVEGEQLYNLVKTTNVGSVDLGTLNWAYRNGIFSTSGLSSLISDIANNYVIAKLLCSRYLKTSYSGKSFADKEICETGGNKLIHIKDSSYTDAATFKTAMNGVMLNFELASPTQTTIATNLHFSEISMLIAEGGTIKPLYNNVPVDTTLTFVVKKAISE